MSILIEKQFLNYTEDAGKTNQQLPAFACFPAPDADVHPVFALMTHGYTSHKGSILNWAVRLAEVGVSCFLFDLPGHYLGNFSEVSSFEKFKQLTPTLFVEALEQLKKRFIQQFPLYEHLIEPDQLKLILAGHSLGAYLALEAVLLKAFQSINTLNIGVGLGLAPEGVTHIFDTPFYQSTLDVRRQLVSPAIAPDKVFPWIKEGKEKLAVTKRRIHLISGLDDAVVGKNGVERLAQLLEGRGNHVSVERPAKLGHHLPDMAAPFLKKFLKDSGLI